MLLSVVRSIRKISFRKTVFSNFSFRTCNLVFTEVMNLSLLWLKINFTNTLRDAESLFSPLSLSQHTSLVSGSRSLCWQKTLTIFFSNNTHRLGTMLSPERRSSSSSSHLGEDTVNA